MHRESIDTDDDNQEQNFEEYKFWIEDDRDEETLNVIVYYKTFEEKVPAKAITTEISKFDEYNTINFIFTSDGSELKHRFTSLVIEENSNLNEIRKVCFYDKTDGNMDEEYLVDICKEIKSNLAREISFNGFTSEILRELFNNWQNLFQCAKIIKFESII